MIGSPETPSLQRSRFPFLLLLSIHFRESTPSAKVNVLK